LPNWPLVSASGSTTVHRYVAEAVELLAARAPDLKTAVRTARLSGHAPMSHRHVIMFEYDFCSAPRSRKMP
jgi:hypothetical protein